jgi:hypothetical protein
MLIQLANQFADQAISVEKESEILAEKQFDPSMHV